MPSVVLLLTSITRPSNDRGVQRRVAARAKRGRAIIRCNAMLSGARATDIRSSCMEAPRDIEELANCVRKDISQASRIIRGRNRARFLAGPE
jgi:hypothetical protein